MATVSDGNVMEVTTFTIKAGTQAKFEPALREVCEIVSRQAGYFSHIVQKSVESDTRYVLLIEWRSVADHTETFGKSEDAKACGALVVPYFDGNPTVEHFTRL